MQKKLIPVLLLFSSFLQAQVNHRFTVSAGYQQSTIALEQEKLIVFGDPQWLYSPYGGVAYRWQSGKSELGTGLYYSQKGVFHKNAFAQGNHNKFTYQYLDIPITFGYRLHKRLVVTGGIINGIGISSRNIQVIESGPKNPSPYRKYQDYDLALQLGINLVLTDRIRICTAYSKGVTETPEFTGYHHLFNTRIAYDLYKK
jgi:hypothetical protein